MYVHIKSSIYFTIVFAKHHKLLRWSTTHDVKLYQETYIDNVSDIDTAHLECGIMRSFINICN